MIGVLGTCGAESTVLRLTFTSFAKTGRVSNKPIFLNYAEGKYAYNAEDHMSGRMTASGRVVNPSCFERGKFNKAVLKCVSVVEVYVFKVPNI